MKIFGLIGYPLSHSWSARYFTGKFRSLGLNDHIYKLFPLDTPGQVLELLNQNPGISGLNVTIPFKVSILPYLDETDAVAIRAGAVNCIRVKKMHRSFRLTGYNTDVHGFRESLRPLLEHPHQKALVLGTGGASRAVCLVLEELGITYFKVSRSPTADLAIGFNDIDKDMMQSHTLIINTTPLGMFPDTESFPPIPYHWLTTDHLLYDLVYNPEETTFLKLGKDNGTQTCNGMKMLELQAEKSWEVWNY